MPRPQINIFLSSKSAPIFKVSELSRASAISKHNYSLAEDLGSLPLLFMKKKYPTAGFELAPLRFEV